MAMCPSSAEVSAEGLRLPSAAAIMDHEDLSSHPERHGEKRLRLLTDYELGAFLRQNGCDLIDFRSVLDQKSMYETFRRRGKTIKGYRERITGDGHTISVPFIKFWASAYITKHYVAHLPWSAYVRDTFRVYHHVNLLNPINIIKSANTSRNNGGPGSSVGQPANTSDPPQQQRCCDRALVEADQLRSEMGSLTLENSVIERVNKELALENRTLRRKRRAISKKSVE